MLDTRIVCIKFPQLPYQLVNGNQSDGHFIIRDKPRSIMKLRKKRQKFLEISSESLQAIRPEFNYHDINQVEKLGGSRQNIRLGTLNIALENDRTFKA